jgi:hypothetical protein
VIFYCWKKFERGVESSWRQATTGIRPGHKETSVRYLCLVYFEQVVLDRMSDDEKRILDRDSLDYDDELRKSGHYLHSNALQSTANAVTVRVRNKRISSSDGPFAETKEHLGGFILIEAASMDEAARLASGIPMAKLGSVEVRPIYDIVDTR